MKHVRNKPFKWFVIGAIAIITLMGGGLRMYHLGHDGFWMDEAFSVQAARAIQEHGVPRFANGETSWGWLPMHYVMAASMFLPGDMHLTSRLPSLLAGTFMIPLVALLAYLITRSYMAALLAAFLVAFSVPDIAWSRQARGYMFLQFTGFLGVGSIVWSVIRNRFAGLIIGASMLSLAILTHRAGYVYWLTSAGIMMMSWVDRRSERQRAGRWVAMGALVLPLMSALLLPSGASQGLDSSWGGITESTPAPSYARNYINLLVDFFGLNTAWAIVGFVGMIRISWRLGVPFIAGFFAYLFVLSEMTILFHVRYLVPVLPVMHLAIASGPVYLVSYIGRVCNSRTNRHVLVGIVMVVWTVTSVTQNLTFVPSSSYELGPTEPQADWRSAFAWLSQQEESPATITCLPVFHDLYLGADRGSKYFLPFTFTHIPGQWQEKPSYTTARIISKLGAYRMARGGYIMLDEFSFNALKDQGLKAMVIKKPPIFITDDQSVRIWRVAD